MSKLHTFSQKTQDVYYGCIGLLSHKTDRAFVKMASLAAASLGMSDAMAASAFGSANGYETSGGGGKALKDVIENTSANLKEPAFVGLGVAGISVGAFQVYSGISNFTKRSSGQGGQQGSIADDLKKIGGGGALAAVGGFAGMSSETMSLLFK